MASIRKRGDTFTITAYMGYDEKGKQRKKTTTYKPPENVTPGKAEKLAKQYAAVWEEKIRGYVALDENRTFAELAEWYYTTVAPSVLKQKTLQNYRSEIERHVMPTLGREKLKNITPPMIDYLLADLQKNGNMETHYRLKDKAIFDGIKRETFYEKAGVSRSILFCTLQGKSIRKGNAEKIAAALGMPLDKVFNNESISGLSGATVNKIKLNLSAIFTAAVKKEIMRRNPCKLATPPKIDTAPAAFFDEEQSRRFLVALHDQSDFQFEVICNLFLATGIRSGELTALHWEDIDFQTGILYIQHTLIRMNGEFLRDTPKTSCSERRIILPTYILDLLKKHKVEQAKKRMQAGVVWKVPDAVFTNTVGNYLIGANLNVKLKKLCRQAGLPEIHLHSLRHTHASLLINSNITAKVISDRLGHSTTKTTLDTYSHVFAESEVKAMQAIDMALFHSTENETEKNAPNGTPLRIAK